MKQGHREKLSVTVDPRLYHVIERHAQRTKVPKSRIIEEAIRLWERSRLAALAREGYRRTADEDRRDAEAYLLALDEIEER
ncbi:MAG: ribbon-helix-helix domain-containing protein [Candidatus Rokubacteria bacterium]|nr:ribbon-helix-helix domain-containing protein [Candidatus Rokubacteria bacterium]